MSEDCTGVCASIRLRLRDEGIIRLRRLIHLRRFRTKVSGHEILAARYCQTYASNTAKTRVVPRILRLFGSIYTVLWRGL